MKWWGRRASARAGPRGNRFTPERRRAARYPTSLIRVLIDSQIYAVGDISVSGVRVIDAPDWIAVRQIVYFAFEIDTGTKEIYVPAHGRVVRRAGNDVALTYSTIVENWQQLLLRYVIDG